MTFKNNAGAVTKTVTKTVTYTYDIFDRRLSKTIDADSPGPAVASRDTPVDAR